MLKLNLGYFTELKQNYMELEIICPFWHPILLKFDLQIL